MSRRSTWKPLLVLSVMVAAVVLFWKNLPDSRVYDAFEMHGGPVVMNSADPTILVLTSHFDSPRIVSTRFRYARKTQLHWDLFAYRAADLTPRWTTRLATVERGQRSLDAALLGVSNGTAWVLADDLMAISVRDGRVIGDAALIESRNSVLRGVMPTSRRQIYFDDGLVLVAADGQRWRIDHETLAATPDSGMVKTSGVGVPASRATAGDHFLPLRLSVQHQAYKSRGYVVGDTWYGLMHPSEVEQQRTDPHTQDFALGLRYRLWAAPLRDTVNRFRDRVRLPVDYAPRAASPEFLLGGLLTLSDANGRAGVVGIANPTRFLVLHQDRVDAVATQTLTCVGLDGAVCWSAPLNVSLATGFAPLTDGGPANWALIVIGERRPEGTVSLGRVAMRDGRTHAMSLASIDLAALARELTPYRTR